MPELTAKQKIAQTKAIIDKVTGGDKIKLVGDNIRFVGPTGTIRPGAEVPLKNTYFHQSDDGELLANYDVVLENFVEEDNSLNFEEFVDIRNVDAQSKLVLQTDKIRGMDPNGTITTANDEGQDTKKKFQQKMKQEIIYCDLEYSTTLSKVDLKDNNMTKAIAFDLKASDMEQHSRGLKLHKNGYILNGIVENAVKLGEVSLDLGASNLRDARIAVGKILVAKIKRYAEEATELMTESLPGGLSTSDLKGTFSPTASGCIVDYLSTLNSSDAAYQDLTKETPGRAIIAGITFDTTNLLVAGKKLSVTTDDGTNVVLFENSLNVECLIHIKPYVKYLKAKEYVKSAPMISNGMLQEQIIGQYVEGTHKVASRSTIADPFTHGYIVINRTAAIVEPIVGDLTLVEGSVTSTTAEVMLSKLDFGNVTIHSAVINDPTGQSTFTSIDITGLESTSPQKFSIVGMTAGTDIVVRAEVRYGLNGVEYVDSVLEFTTPAEPARTANEPKNDIEASVKEVINNQNKPKHKKGNSH